MSEILFYIAWLGSIGLLWLAWFSYRAHEKVIRNASPAAFLDDLDARIARAQQDREEAEGEVQRLRQKCEELQPLADAEERRLESTRAEVARLSEQIAGMEPKLAELARVEQDLGRAQSAVDRARDEFADVQKAVAAQHAELGRAQAEMAAATAHRDEALREFRETEERLETLRVDVAQLEAQARNLSGVVAGLAEERERLEAAARDLRQELATLNDRHAELTREVRYLEQDRDTLKGLVTELDEDRKRREDVLHGLEKSERELREAEARAKRDAEVEEGRLRKAQADIEEARRTLQRLDAEIKQQVHDRAQLAEECKSLGSRVNELEKEKAILEGSIEGLGKTRAGLESLVATLQGAVAEATGTAKAPPVGEALADLGRSLGLPAILAPSATAPPETHCLRRLENHLKAKGLLFDPRVLGAFHTSLKTADYNQLTVLAGVSGTGKSALPRAYAEAMGIHAHVISVQPGWAGPQDLLGFFNYLERKYKATDLTRYLAAFSRYAREDMAPFASGDLGSRSEELLLVLFDEMNLARVEYYFSEFLSRLEMRSSINPGDSEARRKVALPLETGPLEGVSRGLALYPDTNIFFVGTMNEDESTQTLSDKVVDRANVLRFGSPPNAVFGKGSGQGDSGSKSPVELLPRSAWEAWCSEARTGVDREKRLKKLRVELPRVAQAMEDLGRPFGHRVHKAMEKYIMAYASAEAMDEEQIGAVAFADQIEQKILPKLRGTDTAEHAKALENLESVISGLDDNDLQRSFSDAQNRPTFDWHGVKRGEDPAAKGNGK